MRNQFLTLLSLVAVLGIALPLSAAEDSLGIEKLMSAQERAETGIDSLSPAELEALNSWLQNNDIGESRNSRAAEVVSAARGGATAAPAVIEATATPEEAEVQADAVADDGFGQPRERREINSRISGEFNGWTGRTTFRLDNGQVWQQRRGRRWKITLDNPEVTIKENFLGAYEMEVVAEGRSIGVRRIR